LSRRLLRGGSRIHTMAPSCSAPSWRLDKALQGKWGKRRRHPVPELVVARLVRQARRGLQERRPEVCPPPGSARRSLLRGADPKSVLHQGVLAGACCVASAGDWEGLPTARDLTLPARASGTVLR